MNLVDEDDGAAAGPPAPVLRRRHDVLDLLDPRQHGAERDEMCFCHLGDDAGERGLAGAGWTPQDDRLNEVALDRLTQRPAWRENLVLADDLVERPRPHPLGEWSTGPLAIRRT